MNDFFSNQLDIVYVIYAYFAILIELSDELWITILYLSHENRSLNVASHVFDEILS